MRPDGAGDPRTRCCGQPPFRHGAQHLDLNGAGDQAGHRSGAGDALGVAGDVCALYLAVPLHDDSVVREVRAVGQGLGRDEQLVEADDGGRLEHNVEGSSRGWLRPVDKPDRGAVVVALRD
jgi:hypothetical protein